MRSAAATDPVTRSEEYSNIFEVNYSDLRNDGRWSMFDANGYTAAELT